MTQAFPLQWPTGWDRTAAHQRQDGRHKFKRGDWKGGYRYISMSEGIAALLEELRLLGASRVTVSSNVALRQDGLPKSGQRTPDDPGVAVYFRFGDDMAMARDEYARPEDNIRSLTLAIAGMRQLDRHGGGKMVQRAFKGFAALPAPGASGNPQQGWWSVLGVSPNAPTGQIQAAWKEKCREAGGATTELNAARDQGIAAAQG